MNFSSGALHLPLTHFPPLASGMRGANREQERNVGFLTAKWWKSALDVHRRVFRHWRGCAHYGSHQEQPCWRSVTLERLPPPLSPLSFIHISSYHSSTVCINVFQPGSPSVALHPSTPSGSESHSRWRSENPKAASPKVGAVAQIQF